MRAPGAVTPGGDDDERDAAGHLPESEFHHALLVAEVIAGVGPEDDDGVVGAAGGVERVKEPAEHFVTVGRGSLTLLSR